MTKEFEFKKLIKNKGYYCSLSYEISFTAEPIFYLKTNIGEDKWDSKWLSALNFAGAYYIEKFSNQNTGGIELNLLDIQTQIIDTSNMVVFHTLILLLSHETGFNIPNYEFTPDGNWIVPK